MEHTIEITKEAFWLLVGNDQKTWYDYTASKLSESSYYYNHGVTLFTVTNFISEVTQYYIQGIKS